MDKHPQSGKVVKLKNGALFEVFDWWESIVGPNWMSNPVSPVCIEYLKRVIEYRLPLDNQVVYGHIISDHASHQGHLIHNSEIIEEVI